MLSNRRTRDVVATQELGVRILRTPVARNFALKREEISERIEQSRARTTYQSARISRTLFRDIKKLLFAIVSDGDRGVFPGDGFVSISSQRTTNRGLRATRVVGRGNRDGESRSRRGSRLLSVRKDGRGGLPSLQNALFEPFEGAISGVETTNKSLGVLD